MPTFSPECTFILKTEPHEITGKRAGEGLVARINKDLHRPKWCLPLKAKLDAMQNPRGPGSTTWCVEITPLPGFHWETNWLEDKGGWRALRKTIAHMFRTCRSHGLVPSFTQQDGDTELHYPGGGCHLHMGIGGLFSSTQPDRWYKRMEAYHRNWLMDYTNRPYIRWLFSHWFADKGTEVLIHDVGYLPTDGSVYDPLQRAKVCTSTIEPRYMDSVKGNHLTMEVRLFSMVESPDELKLIAQFAAAWMAHIREKTVGGTWDYFPEPQMIPLDLDADKLAALKVPAKARAICEGFFTDALKLEWKPYSAFFERNYLRRIKWGAFV
jgi:hypothetical protein